MSNEKLLNTETETAQAKPETEAGAVAGTPANAASGDGAAAASSITVQEQGSSPETEKNSEESSLQPETAETSAEPSASQADTPAAQDMPEAAPETLAEGQPPLPPVPPDAPAISAAGDPDNLPVQSAETPPAVPDEGMNGEKSDKPMGLMDHLSELRARLVRACLAVMAGFIACWAVVDPIFDALVNPLLKVLPEGSHAIYTTLPEGFFTRMHISFVAGVFVSSPVIFYQVWAFIAPGLYEEEKQDIIPIAIMSALFFLSGGAFCYFVVFPNAFAFFVSYATDSIVAMPKISDYLSLVLKLILAFGLVFEMPLFAFFLARLGIITAELMRKVRRYAILGIFIVAAILSPPDVVSQLLMACPMLILYEISILVAAAVGKRGKKKAEKEGQTEEKASENDAAAADGTNKETKHPSEEA